MSEDVKQAMPGVTADGSLAGLCLPFGEPPPAAPRLFCFPSAGASAAAFAPWRSLVGEGVRVCPVQPPGRAERFREAPYDRCDQLVGHLAAALSEQFTGTYALYGHSMGALVAFELAREIRRMDAGPPVHLFVSGRAAPQLPDTRRPLRDLPADELIGEVAGMGGTPEAVLREKDLMALLLPLLRADLGVNETYQYRPEPLLDVPLTVFGGQEDPRADRTELLAWESLTRARFRSHMFPGGHFFINDRPQELLETMVMPLRG
ncbi:MULTISPECIES: alpha/beta fold hydrolase [unclassified Streptomyces]|uniref:thioesterase II family protein n=1 Tax=unclassified Streptomyces TaxID=2593676 RepID=UPI0033167892